MKVKLAFVVGIALGYLLSGRENLEKAKTWARESWENPNVQSTVHNVEERVTKVVREQGSQLTEKVKEATGRGGARPEEPSI